LLKALLKNVNAKHGRDIDDCLRVTERLKQKSTLYWIGPLPIYHMNDIDHTSRPISCNHLKQVFSIKSLAFENNFQFVEHRGSVPNVSRSNQDNRYASLNVTHAATIGLRVRPLARWQQTLLVQSLPATWACISVPAAVNLLEPRHLTFINTELILVKLR